MELWSMEMNKIYVLIFFILMTLKANARVRDVTTSSSSMETIYLVMGKSTVLRFSEKPLKGIVGNQNYYSLEFIENTNDVTIQPLGTVSTNLFIYGKNHVYGFILKTAMTGNYDDLVKVHWRYRPNSYTDRKPVISHKKKNLLLKFRLKNQLEFEVDDIVLNPVIKLWILDLKVKNLSDKSD